MAKGKDIHVAFFQIILPIKNHKIKTQNRTIDVQKKSFINNLEGVLSYTGKTRSLQNLA